MKQLNKTFLRKVVSALFFSGIIFSSSGSFSGTGSDTSVGMVDLAGEYEDLYLDKQMLEIKMSFKNIKADMVSKGIRLIIPVDDLFESNSGDLKPQAAIIFDDLSDILKKYDKTKVLVTVHTDSDGAEDINLRITKKRAEVIETQINKTGVKKSRITAFGFGEIQPISSNSDAEGKKQNRRVELLIY